MSSTTLVTFLFESAPAARTIELLGSWDNFQKPYSMKLDLRKGKNFWSGCYSFEGIICDGDLGHHGLRRNGALKMGGTYWYYYRIDGTDECHDPSQASTTFCPLLPGQRLNILEVPYDSRSRSNSASSTSSGVHTLNPEDKYLNPRPAPVPLPKIITSSHSLDDHRKRSHMQMRTPVTHDRDYSRSAGYDTPRRNLSESPFRRHAKSATSSPTDSLKPTLFDFRDASDKIKATFESVTSLKPTPLEEERGRSRHARGGRALDIGFPTLVSGLDEPRSLIPLDIGVSEAQLATPVVPSMTSAKVFSPLRSHPVNQNRDSSTDGGVIEPPLKKPRSQAQYSPPPPIAFSHDIFQARGRAISAEHKRSKSPRRSRSSKEPAEALYRRRSMSVGKVREPSPLRNNVVYDEPLLIPDQIQEANDEDDANIQTPETMWTSFLAPPTRESSRPRSRHGEGPEQSPRSLPLIDKELPALPSYLVPEPLFFEDGDLDHSDDLLNVENTMAYTEPSSHFSLWSTTSIELPALSTDGDGAHSPTFSTITESSSNIGTPQRFSDQYTGNLTTFYDAASSDDGLLDLCHPSPEGHVTHVSHEPPYLDCTTPRNPTVGQGLFNFDLSQPESSSRRHATCFGLSEDSQGYSLPQEHTASQTTLTKTAAPAFTDSSTTVVDQNLGTDPTMTQLEQLMNDFGYLGEAVL